jgi:hypothetical protein
VLDGRGDDREQVGESAKVGLLGRLVLGETEVF